MAKRTFVLLHGAFHGGWCWAKVRDILVSEGHRVTTPTQTGLGERKHLLSPQITIDTFIEDLVNHIEAEELSDVVLVGHSFGGMAITGAADRMPDRIRHLVYLDSRVVENGQAVFDQTPPEIVAERIALARKSSGGVSCPPSDPVAFGVPEHHPLSGWVKRRLTPHPMNTFTSALRLKHPVGNGRPRTYVCCTDPIYASLESSRQWVKAQQGWGWRDIATGHDAMITAPEELAVMLRELAG